MRSERNEVFFRLIFCGLIIVRVRVVLSHAYFYLICIFLSYIRRIF